jgi:peptidoglycan/LPS O-acetylase OafA/YrhL
MSRSKSSGSSRRADIQILRGYAVLLVLIYHAGLNLLPGGFVGVDVFFVISGFLITGIIRRDLEKRTFSLQVFYTRRAKRLFPAAYVTLLMTVLASPYLLTSSELHDYGKQLVGALTFTANYALKSQTGYFDGAADLKPLLHTWSLSVEEQFYFLIPTLLMLIPSRVHGIFFLILFSLSLAGCFIAKANPETVFYTLPYRGWELALGAIGAIYPRNLMQHSQAKGFILVLPWLLLTLVPIFPSARLYPVLSALVACFATVCLLIANPSFRMGILLRGMVTLGDLSYALYLVHWPLFAFFSNLLIQPAPLVSWIRGGLISLSILLAWALHHVIERPFLKSQAQGLKVLLFSVLGAAFLVALFKLESPDHPSLELWSRFRSPNIGLNKLCVTAGAVNFDPCRNGSSPQYLVWGDSMAMQLVNGIAISREPSVPLIQATRHACAPLMGLADYRNKADRRYEWESVCMAFNDQILESLGKVNTLKTVILSGNLMTYLKPERLLVYRSQEDGTLMHDVSHSDRIFEALKQTIDGIRALGLRVVMVAAPPNAPFDVSRCLERRMRSLLTYGGAPSCRIDQHVMSIENQALTTFLAKLKRELQVNTLTFDSTLCEEGQCNTVLDGIPLYRDDAHLSNDGGSALIQKMRLIDRIDAEAD